MSTTYRENDLRSRLIVIFTIITAVAVGIIFALFQLMRPRPAEVPMVKAVTAYFPLTYLANPILGEGRGAEVLIPVGADPHSYSPTPSDIVKAKEAEVFFLLGEEPTELEELFLKDKNDKTQIIAAGQGIDYLPAGFEEGNDVHTWLSPRHAAIIVSNIAMGLSELHPDDSVVYRARAAEFLARLQELDEEFRKTLSSCERDTIMVSHNAFSYLGLEYGFRIITLYGSEEDGVTPLRMMNAIDTVKQLGVPYLFYTSDANTENIINIAADLGVEALPLHTMETSSHPGLPEISRETSVGYLTVIRDNLRLISQSLNCQL